jgi:hypothetical protein
MLQSRVGRQLAAASSDEVPKERVSPVPSTGDRQPNLAIR